MQGDQANSCLRGFALGSSDEGFTVPQSPIRPPQCATPAAHTDHRAEENKENMISSQPHSVQALADKGCLELFEVKRVWLVWSSVRCCCSDNITVV